MSDLPQGITAVTFDLLFRIAKGTGLLVSHRSCSGCCLLVPSMIYGSGLGLPTDSFQLPIIIRKSRERGAGVYIGKGVNRWSNVHIKDLAELYLLALENAPTASYFYAENGEESYKDLAKFVSQALGYGGQTVSWSFDEAVSEFGGGARFALASNSRVFAVHARNLLGWNPMGESIQSWIAHNVK